MTADPHTTNSGPGEALSAPLAASTPLAGVWRPSEGLSGPQTGAQSLGSDREAVKRTKWPAAQHLQQAADLLRQPDPNLDPEREYYTAPPGDWLDKVANEMAWLAPYRDHEGGYRPWRMATRTAHGVLGLSDPDGCTVCHPQRRT